MHWYTPSVKRHSVLAENLREAKSENVASFFIDEDPISVFSCIDIVHFTVGRLPRSTMVYLEATATSGIFRSMDNARHYGRCNHGRHS